MNLESFNNKTVLITGHTGFKGSWLSIWLSKLGAKVIGLSDSVPTQPSHYDLIKDKFIEDLRFDIKDAQNIYSAVKKYSPDFIFHLAAQPIVLESYSNPLNTFTTNIIGTANILDAVRRTNHKCSVVIITSDKCYDNVEWTYGYRETDKLGGKDPYSGSKGAAELVVRSYVKSFFNSVDSNVRIAVGRAGNVIGGGDWASYRIIPDCVRSWSNNKKAIIRNSIATRPWQHVLEPLSGYLTLAIKLNEDKSINGEAFNFGPPAHQNHTVGELVKEIIAYWPGANWVDKSSANTAPNEAGLLKLNCDKALHMLSWQASLNFKQTAKWTSEWYKAYYEYDTVEISKLTSKQIIKYMEIMKESKISK